MVTNVTSLTGDGLRDWLIQRVTAVILAAYTLFLIGYFLLHSPLNYSDWQQLHQCTAMRVFSLLSLLSLILHAWIGVWTITTDYLPRLAIRLTCQLIVIIALVSFFIWGIEILWGSKL